MKSKEQAIQQTFYVKESSNLIGTENFGAKTRQQLIQFAAFPDVYPYVNISSIAHRVLTYYKLNIRNFLWHLEVCLTTPK